MPIKVNSAEDIPWDFALAVSHGLAIINWQENLPKEEIPPEWMWCFDDELEQWFENVKAEREKKYNTGNSKTDYDKPGFMQNEFAAKFSRT